MEKQEWGEGKGLRFPSFREDEVSTEDLPLKGKRPLSVWGTLRASPAC